MRRGNVVALLACIVLAAAAFGAGLWAGRGHGASEGNAGEKRDQPPGVVVIATQVQARSGIETAAPRRYVLQPNASTYAIVVDVQPLLAFARQHAAAQAELRAAQAAADASKRELDRVRALHADDRNMSRKALDAAEAAWRSDHAKADIAAASVREAAASAEQRFGSTLASWASTPPAARLERLAARQEVLVRVALPSTLQGRAPSTISLSAPGYAVSRAQLISDSPQSEGLSPGRVFIYRADASYPAGLRLTADVPLEAKGVEGFLVPDSAVVWYGNQPWVFARTAADRFERRALRGAQQTASGVFTTTAFTQVDALVTTGAQLLQSELVRPKTPGTAACADPECD